tara:strand:- start:163 stop:306 length:144 start_codon:yes stop_codon:yes gene_type:complete
MEIHKKILFSLCGITNLIYIYDKSCIVVAMKKKERRRRRRRRRRRLV